MRIIEPNVEILSDINSDIILKNLELYGRVCYKSEDKITKDSAKIGRASCRERVYVSV